jgi:hypothetical protein
LLFFLFFFFFWWTIAPSKIVFHCSWSCYLCFQFLTPMFFISSLTGLDYLNLGFPTCQVHSGLNRVSFQQGSLSWILKKFPNHLSIPIFIIIHPTAYKAYYYVLFSYTIIVNRAIKIKFNILLSKVWSLHPSSSDRGQYSLS